MEQPLLSARTLPDTIFSSSQRLVCRDQTRSCSCSLLLPLLRQLLPAGVDLCAAEVATWLTHVLLLLLLLLCVYAMRAYPLHDLLRSPSVIRGLGCFCCWRSNLCRDMLMFSLLMLLTHSLWIGGVKCATCVPWLTVWELEEYRVP